jgi:cysteinyl-tRNA synthetase
MAEALLGLDFDIHGGGSDLLFPHHENEIAQTEAGRGRPLARLWVHNGMIRFGEEKMAKSVGNVAALADALDDYGRDVLLMYLLGGHYRQPLAFSADTLEQASRSLDRIRNFARLLARSEADTPGAPPDRAVAARREAFFAALADDFNTPRALAALFELVAEGNRRLEAGERFAGAADALAEMLDVVGLRGLLAGEKPPDPEAQRLAAERETARRERDFARADAIRDELAGRGWEIRDTADGPELVRRAAGAAD